MVLGPGCDIYVLTTTPTTPCAGAAERRPKAASRHHTGEQQCSIVDDSLLDIQLIFELCFVLKVSMQAISVSLAHIIPLSHVTSGCRTHLCARPLPVRSAAHPPYPLTCIHSLRNNKGVFAKTEIIVPGRSDFGPRLG